MKFDREHHNPGPYNTLCSSPNNYLTAEPIFFKKQRKINSVDKCLYLFSNNVAAEFKFYEYNSLRVYAKFLKPVSFNAG